MEVTESEALVTPNMFLNSKTLKKKGTITLNLNHLYFFPVYIIMNDFFLILNLENDH